MKAKILITVGSVVACVLTGCEAMRDPGVWQSIQEGSQPARQYPQPPQQQKTQPEETQTSQLWNRYTRQYQYVPPGWHYRWDSQNNTWIIQP